MVKTLRWQDETLFVLDQTKLPHEVVEIECRDHQAVVRAIKEMRVRGAPAIGVAAAYGMALGALASRAETLADLRTEMVGVAADLRATRPTAFNLFWAIDRMVRVVRAAADVASARAALIAEAELVAAEDVEVCRRIGRFGAELVPDGARVLSHCNAGALATAGYGTSLGVIRSAHEQGKRIHVFVDETRPLLQGARLTAWELAQEGIPQTLITDNMAGHFMRLGQIDLVVVGADRIAANGDVANKIGTYGVAVLAREHGLPFYVAAPTSTVDLGLATGDEIVIEQRSADEVLHFAGRRVAPEGVRAANPGFDVTPNRYVAAIITEYGIIRPPFASGLADACALGGRSHSEVGS